MKTPEEKFEWPSEIRDWMTQIDWEAAKRHLAAGPLELAKIGWLVSHQ